MRKIICSGFCYCSHPPFKCNTPTQDWDIREGAEVNIISNASDQDDGRMVDGLEIGDVVGQRYLEKRSPKKKLKPPFDPFSKKKIKTKLKWKPKKKIKTGLKLKSKKVYFVKALPTFIKKEVIALQTFNLVVRPSRKEFLPLLAPGKKKLAGLTLASPPLALLLPKSKPKLAKPALKAPKAVASLALAPKAAKLLKAGPLSAPALLKKGTGPLLPLKKKAKKKPALGLPAVVLLSQNQGGGNQRSGGRSSSSGGNRTLGCNRNGSSNSRNSKGSRQNDPCAREGDTRPAEEETTTRAPTEEEKEAALEAQAALREAQATINEANAAMQQALTAMQGTRLPTGMQEALAALGRA